MIGEVQFTNLQAPMTAVKSHLISPWCTISSQEVNSKDADSHFFPLKFWVPRCAPALIPPTSKHDANVYE